MWPNSGASLARTALAAALIAAGAAGATFTPFESMPEWLQRLMYLAPSTHFVRFA